MEWNSFFTGIVAQGFGDITNFGPI